MARKAMDTTDNAVETRQEEAVEEKKDAGAQAGQEKPESNKSGFYCYIGPNLKNLIQTGSIYRGTRRQALAKAAEAIKAQPLVKTLIVSGDALPTARIKVKTPGNVLYANYQKLAGKE